MVYGNIIKQLKKDGYEVNPMQFSFKDCLGVTGTAIINLEDEEVVECEAKYTDVVAAINNGLSHVYTITKDKAGRKKKTLSKYPKWGG